MRTFGLIRRSLLCALAVALPLAAAGCGEVNDPPFDVSPDVAETQADSVETDVTDNDVAPPEDVVADTTEPIIYDRPSFFPNDEEAGEVLAFDGFSQPVRVVYDDRGIPHIYAANATDISRAQGYVTARDRIFQMHTLRSAAKGRLAEFSGSSALSGDLFLRMLKLGHVAKDMADQAIANDALLGPQLTAFADGVNAYLVNMRAGREVKPPELVIFGSAMVYDWTPEDTMAIVRLQTWDLGFGGIVEELKLLEYLMKLKERHGDGPLAGIWKDVANFAPAAKTPTVIPDGGIPQTGTFDLDDVLNNPFFQGLELSHIVEVKAGIDAMEFIPHRAFRAEGEMYGSNNWVVSGAHTAHGRPIVSNDTHLSLRNPAVFYQIHLDTKRAGGDISLSGVNFAGAPGIVLGHNDDIAWGATVVYSDTTDAYVERFVPEDADMGIGPFDMVFQNGSEQVAVEKRVETFRFAKQEGKACIDTAPSYVKNLEWSERLEGSTCVLDVTILDVPGHGPIIPWSFREDADGALLAVSWKWTGFEATDELGAIARLNLATNFDEFKAALDRFSVGSQNWIYGDRAGNIGWYPSHRVPIREHIAAGNTNYPPFLPMPGDTGECEWDGFIPRADLPQAYNPEKGFIITANADPEGFVFDNDPFNDGIYFGHAWDIGYRMDQIDRRIRGVIDAGDKFDYQTMAAIQGDHTSRFGADMVPKLLEAVAAAKDGSDVRAAAALTPAIEAAAARLALWEGLKWESASGVGAVAGSDEAKASIATAIFNAWVKFFIEDLVFDDGLTGLGGSMTARFVRRLVLEPEVLYTYNVGLDAHPVWDDSTTTDVVETPAEIMVKSLGKAIAFLSNPEVVGPRKSGGFGTADMDMWRWGKLHTVTLKHNVAPAFDIPKASLMPDGFPRPGDIFGVDASDPGIFGRKFTYAHGAAIRNVYDMTDPVVFHGVIPGGQAENPLRPFYDDGAQSWSRNEAPAVVSEVADVLSKKTAVLDFVTVSE